MKPIFFGGICITLLGLISGCDLFSSDADINRGVYNGPVSYRVYTYTPDSALPAFRTYSENYEVILKENKKGLFIEYSSNKYFFDKENKIDISTQNGYIKYLRKSNSIDIDLRSDQTYTDSTVSLQGSGSLRKN
jgi:hypothetical protein